MLNVLRGEFLLQLPPMHDWTVEIHFCITYLQKSGVVTSGKHHLLSFHKPKLVYVCVQAPSITSHFQLLTEKHQTRGVKKNLHSSKMMQNAFIRATLVKIWNEPHLLLIQALQANSEDEGQTLAQQTSSWGFTSCANQ